MEGFEKAIKKKIFKISSSILNFKPSGVLQWGLWGFVLDLTWCVYTAIYPHQLPKLSDFLSFSPFPTLE